MSLEIKSQFPVVQNVEAQLTAKKEMEHLVGVLWYEMLSSLNETGMTADTLGVGGSNFESAFLWNISENDFGKYDLGLLHAALHQVGGLSSQTPAVVHSQLGSVSLESPETIPVFQQSLTDSLSTEPHHLIVKATDFVKSIWPEVKAAAKILGVPVVAVLAQTALETGWGSSAPGCNLFGIKAIDGEAGALRATHEMIDGILTPKIADFREYNSTAESISDYVSLIKADYPMVIGQNSVSGFATALQNSGYATDHGYARKIEQIAKSPLMSHVLQEIKTMN